MPHQYIPILLYAILAAAFPAVTLAVAKYIRPDMKATGAKLEPYECGVPPEGSSRGRYSVRFYIVAILFVIFDVETIFLLPFAVSFGGLKVGAFIAMVIFLLLLVEGLAWAWQKGVLTWS